MEKHSRVYAQIDLDAIVDNLEQMKGNLKEGTKILAVIKTDGYGHGASEIAHQIEDNDYLYGFAVATMQEALSLRDDQIKKPILILGCVFLEELELAVKHEIRVAVYRYDLAKKLSEIGEKFQKEVFVHIKVDTGMGRLGFLADDASVDEIEKISKLKQIRLEGLFTHFAKADEREKAFTKIQMERFRRIVDCLRERKITPPLLHCSNSAGIIDLPEANMNMVRAGISLYGLWPSDEVDRGRIRLRPALALMSQVVFIKELQDGDTVSYGGTYRVRGRQRIATIPVGYGDGYPRSLSNKGYCLIRGQRAYITGRICMDYFMVDVTEIDGVSEGDTVTLIGTDGGEQITVEQLAALSGRFNYEFVCCLSKRIPREYVTAGQPAAQIG